MNILQTEDIIKGLPDNRLIEEAQTPTGQLPSYLIVSEIQRRADMRKRFSEQQPEGTVAEQIIQEGIMSLEQGPTDFPRVPPNTPNPLPQGQGLIPSDQQFPPMDSNAALIPNFAGGGIVSLGNSASGSAMMLENAIKRNAPRHEIMAIAAGDPDLLEYMNEYYEGQPEADSGLVEQNNNTPLFALGEGFGEGFDELPEHKERMLAKKVTGISVQGTGSKKIDISGIASLGYLEKLTGMAGKPAGNVPDLSDLIEQQRKDAYSQALIQIGGGIATGIAGDGLSGGLSRAGESVAASNQRIRDIEISQRMAQYKADQDVEDRDIKIYGGAARIEAMNARNAAQIEAMRSRSLEPGKPSAAQESIASLAEVILRRKNDPNDVAFIEGGYTLRQALDEATEIRLTQSGTKITPEGQALKVDTIAGIVTDQPIDFDIADMPPPKVTAMGLSDSVAGPVASVARTGEKIMSALGLPIDAKLSEQRRFVLGILPNLVRSRSVNPEGRIAETERKLILAQMGIEPGFFTGPGEWEANLRAFDMLLGFDEQASMAVIRSTGIPSDMKAKAIKKYIATRNARALLGVNQSQKVEIIAVN